MLFELLILFIELIGIFSVFKLRDYLFKRKSIEKSSMEDTIICFLFSLLLIVFGILLNMRILCLMSLPFLVYLIVPVVIFSVRQWKEFLDLIILYLRR